jgi:hypothetical protein
MPRSSQKQEYLKLLKRVMMLMMRDYAWRLENGISCNSLDDLLFIYIQLYTVATSHRYLFRNQYATTDSDKWTGCLQLPPDGFKLLFRMDIDNFYLLVKRMALHESFQLNPLARRQQAPIELQLMVFLQRVGFNGNGASSSLIALRLGISRGSVEGYYLRCLKVIHTWRTEIISWPDVIERAEIAKRISNQCNGRFKSCVGYVDGTLIPFCRLY